MNYKQKTNQYINQREQRDKKNGIYVYTIFLPVARFLRHTMIVGILMALLILSYGMVYGEHALFNIPSVFANSHNKGSIQGFKINPDGTSSTAGATITITNVGSFTNNPYHSGQLNPGTYTVSSSQPDGYRVSYSTNPTGGASTYVTDVTTTITVTAGQNAILWWKYTPVTQTSTPGVIQGQRIDQNESLFSPAATTTITNTSLITTRSLTENPYTSGLIPAGTYTVSSSQLPGYSVSYSTNPTGGASTYVPGATATITVTSGGTVTLWWKYSPVAGTSAIQGSKVDQNGTLSNFDSTITISGVGSFTSNPYNSGIIVPGTYTVSSSQPAGYSVSYSTNPTGGASTYVSGSTATVTVAASQIAILWWKYSPITATTGAIRGSRVGQNGAITNLGATITISGVGPFTTNPYNSGQINPGTYTVSSSQPPGYSVSYSTNPTGGASSYVAGAIATVTVTTGQTVDLWWKYTPVSNTIQGYKVDQNGVISSIEAPITIDGIGSFSSNPYNSGTLTPGTYRVSSFQPPGHTVSYSTNPTGGASTYISGSIATVTVAQGGTVILWWKYTPSFSNIKGYKVDLNGAVSNFGATITISGVGSFTTNPYDSGQIGPGVYRVSSSRLPGYEISYSINPEGGPSTYVASSTAVVTVTVGGTVNLWWKYAPITEPPPSQDVGIIKGYRVDQDGQVTPLVPAATISISGISSFTTNPYNSGEIPPGDYTISSSRPAGYNVSYSINPQGGLSTYISGSTVTLTIAPGQLVNLWWKYSPITGVIQGSKVDQSGQVTSAVPTASITIYGIGFFTGNPYTSGEILQGTYTISSSEPSGYHISYSTNPAGGPSTYTSGSTVTLTLAPGQTINLWWKYSPITNLDIFALELDNLRSSYSPSVLSDQGVRKMWTGWLTDAFFPTIPNSSGLSFIPRANEIFYSEYINGAWTKPSPEHTFRKGGFQINDPSVIKYPGLNSLVMMYYTALDNTDAKQKIFNRHQIGLALNAGKGQSWIDRGIVISYTESGDGKGASSPSAIIVDDEIWVYYHTGTSDFTKPINWLVRFSANASAATASIAPPERLNLIGFIPNNPDWILSNLDVSYRNSQFVLLANTSDLKKIIRLVSDDGINWRRPSSGPHIMINVNNDFVLTPSTEDTGPDRYKIYFGLGDTLTSSAVSTMIRSREFYTASSLPVSTTSLPPSSSPFNTDMAIGATGNNVNALQSCLARDPLVYPQGLVTGYFGLLTQRAVIRFQEKFAAEILAPAGLARGNGIVGPLTRVKLNQVCGL